MLSLRMQTIGAAILGGFGFDYLAGHKR